MTGIGAFALQAKIGKSATLEPVRIGFVPLGDTYLEPRYALDGGFFKRAGITVELSPLQNAGAIASAVAGGSLDVGLGSLNALAAAAARGVPFAIFAAGAIVTTKAPTSLLMVAKDSTIDSAEQCEGKTIAVADLNGLGQMGMQAWMAKMGGDYTRLKFIEMPFSMMATAVIGKKIDAAILTEPTLSANRSELRVLGNPYGAIADNWYISCWYSTLSWLKQNNDVAHAIARVARDTAVWANANPALTAPILSASTKIPIDVVNKMTRARYADKLSVPLMQPVLDWALRSNILKAQVSAKDLIAPSF
jgi:NitT/TauT family transport system substrate-binding protein